MVISHPENLKKGAIYTFTVKDGDIQTKIRGRFEELGQEMGVAHTELVVRYSQSYPGGKGKAAEIVKDFVFWRSLIEVI